jgi:putative phosphoribosyl transferase
MRPFVDRVDAGRKLARALAHLASERPIVLALPRGGAPVAYEVAQRLGAPLDVLVVRKLGTPGHEELAMGAIASGGVRVMNDDVVRITGIGRDSIAHAAMREQLELERRERAYRGDRPMFDVRGRTVILIDDGLATGATMRAAVRAVRQLEPRRVVVAVPVGAPESCAMIQSEVDELVCLERPEMLFGVGAWYEDFSQTRDEDVRRLLASAQQQQGGRAHVEHREP